MERKAVSVILCLFLVTPFVIGNFGFTPLESRVSRERGSAVQVDPLTIQNVTFRLLAIEGFYNNRTDITQNTPPPGTVWSDYPVKSAQYLIQNLLPYTNWQNGTLVAGFRYKSYIHLLSYDPNAATLPYYRGPATNSNVVSEINNFLSQTSQFESNDLTIRIFYYTGHSGTLPTYPKTYPRPIPPPNSFGGTTYMCLGTNGSDPAEYKQIVDPNTLQTITVPKAENPSNYEELWDCQLNTLLLTGDLKNSNCTLLIFDSCHSGGFISTLQRKGRVILTACAQDKLAWGWQPVPRGVAPGQWNWFTGQPDALFSNGTDFGALGLIGGIQKAQDLDNNGWRSANEIFLFANKTTPRYSTRESGISGTGQQEDPQVSLGVKGGDIPLIQYCPPNTLLNSPFPYNAPRAPFAVAGQPWPQYHDSAGRTGVSSALGPRTSLLWSGQLGAGAFGSVLIGEGQAIAGLIDGTLHDLDLGTGQTIWTFKTTDSPVFSTPAELVTPLVDGFLFVATIGGGTNGTLYAVDENTGRLRWNFTTPSGTGGIFASPAVDNGMVFVATMGGGGGGGAFVYALNATTGGKIWNFSAPGPIKSSPAVADGRVFVATMGGGGGGGAYVYGLDETTGLPIWPTPFETDSPVMSTPAVADGKVFVATMGGAGGAYVWALSEYTGTPVWPYPFTTTTGPITSSPAVDSSKGLVVIGSYGGMVYGLNELTGTSLWTQPTGSINMSSPAISSDGLVYIGSTNAYLYCLNEATGLEVWKYATGGPIFSSPALTDNHVLIGSMDGKVYCFGPPFPVHDVAVTNVTVFRTVASQSGFIKINCTIVNKGNVPEKFNTTFAYGFMPLWTPPLYHTPVTIDTQEVTLNPGGNTTLTYTWTPNIPKGKYMIVVQAILPRDNNTADNTVTWGLVAVAMVADITGPNGWPDGRVDMRDVGLVARHFGETVPPGPPNCDMTGPTLGVPDGKIDMRDIGLVARNFGKIDP